MPTFQIICLANSFKRGGRCIAGLKTDGSGWLRPVSSKDDGTLLPGDYILDNYQEPQLFDIIEIDCTQPRPKINHPENWLISQKKWKFVGRPTREQLLNIIKEEIDKNAMTAELFGNGSNRVDYDLIQPNKAKKSLALINPEKIVWVVLEDSYKRKYRVEFYLHHIRYSLPVTDPNWRARLENLPAGNYVAADVEQVNPGDKLLFTVSLGEPFVPDVPNKYFCYKLVAAVINVTQLVNQLK